MPVINIITPFKTSGFIRQLNPSLNPFIFHENGDSNQNYDLIVVYEDLPYATSLNSDKRNLMFIAGEPPFSKKYSKSFLSQFHYVISSHPKIKHINHIQSQQALPWHFGYDYQNYNYKYNFEELQTMAAPNKQRKISVISSGKTMMPGHTKRKRFVEMLKSTFPQDIDFFGKDSNPVNDKADAILPYRMSICIENSSIPNYWTEKLSDVFIGYTLPIYYGCTNIDQYFSSDSTIKIDINLPEQQLSAIQYLIDNCETIYENKLETITNARNLVLNKYNIFNVIADFFQANQLQENKLKRKITLYSNDSFVESKVSNFLLRFERLTNRIIA
jgi:hypothetical protein